MLILTLWTCTPHVHCFQPGISSLLYLYSVPVWNQTTTYSPSAIGREQPGVPRRHKQLLPEHSPGCPCSTRKRKGDHQATVSSSLTLSPSFLLPLFIKVSQSFWPDWGVATALWCLLYVQSYCMCIVRCVCKSVLSTMKELVTIVPLGVYCHLSITISGLHRMKCSLFSLSRDGNTFSYSIVEGGLKGRKGVWILSWLFLNDENVE